MQLLFLQHPKCALQTIQPTAYSAIIFLKIARNTVVHNYLKNQFCLFVSPLTETHLASPLHWGTAGSVTQPQWNRSRDTLQTCCEKSLSSVQFFPTNTQNKCSLLSCPKSEATIFFPPPCIVFNTKRCLFSVSQEQNFMFPSTLHSAVKINSSCMALKDSSFFRSKNLMSLCDDVLG